jgi:phosphatidylserine/phosphatidylglycerophosphate/cardiolipin synthase-like enzyme
MDTRRASRLIATVAERLPKKILSQLVDRLVTLDEHSSFSERMAVSYTTSQGDAREMVADLIRCWNNEEPALPPRSLALALQSASDVDEHHRNREDVQLIWTGPDVSNLPFRRTEQALLELVESAQKSLLIVAFAAYKIPQLVEAMNAVANAGVNVVCVFESHDASGGKVSFSPVKQLGWHLRYETMYGLWLSGRRTRLGATAAFMRSVQLSTAICFFCPAPILRSSHSI